MTRKLFAVVLALCAGLAATIAAGAPTGYISKVQEDAWMDMHTGYPTQPDGEPQIRKTFGEPCNAEARANTYVFVAADNNQPYPVHFHRLLGGADSSNLDNDVPGHIEKAKLDSKLLSGIWGYNCRAKRGGSSYSTHAWGIAVDINASYEPVGATKCNTVTGDLARIWINHRWNWGAGWKDCMHFQYARGY